MTLCIAAACEERGKQRVVIGTDWRIAGSISAGADIQDKLYWINDDIAMLISGEVTRAIELREAYRELLRGVTDEETFTVLTHSNIRQFMRAGIKRFKKHLAEEIVTFATGLSYKDFREGIAKRQIPKEVAIAVYKQIERQNFECDVLIVAFIEEDQFIFQVEKSGHIEECENFGIVGEGTYVAEAFMYLRGHSSDTGLGLSVWDVWEAMNMAATVVDSVGKEHTIDVLYPPGERGKNVVAEFLTNKGTKYLKTLWREELGLRRVKKFPKLPLGSFEPEEDDLSGNESKRSVSQTSKDQQ